MGGQVTSGSAALVGEVRAFAGNAVPEGWHACDGGLLDIDGHQPLFSLLGWRFGGDGQTSFAVPAAQPLPSPITSCIAIDGVYSPRSGDTTLDEPYIGEIRLFAGRFAPPGWVVCDGQRLSLEAPYDRLHDVIRSKYGGDERGFNVPDLREHAPANLAYIIAVSGRAPPDSR